MKGLLTVSAALAATVLLAGAARAQQDIPLPEHPRPDFERAAWVNLNGTWQFRFDAKDEGLTPERWQKGEAAFPLTITVPFPWGSKLSGVPDTATIALVRAHDRGPRRLAGAARLPRRRRLRLAHHGLARRDQARRAPGRVHAVRVRADAARASGHDAAARRCAWTTRTARSSSKASRATATRAASGRRRTWRRAARRRWPPCISRRTWTRAR